MSLTLVEVMGKLRGPTGRKLWRYSMASVVAVVVSVVCLVLLNGVLGMRAWLASTLATAIASIPSYEMNRRWAWGKSGRSHVLKEVVPFWALAFLGWGFSTWAVHAMESFAEGQRYSHPTQTLLVAVVYVAAFGVLWVAKFVVFNQVLFVHRADEVPAIDRPGRVTG